ncbi:hypothetical protein ANO14919_142940 [Xylariales sp. No.14919]|nr:hypothetical protein ANO14919_142940 [Xylariales sp. No.14919]
MHGRSYSILPHDSAHWTIALRGCGSYGIEVYLGGIRYSDMANEVPSHLRHETTPQAYYCLTEDRGDRKCFAGFSRYVRSCGIVRNRSSTARIMARSIPQMEEDGHAAKDAKNTESTISITPSL